jgi:hypothetical protein
VPVEFGPLGPELSQGDLVELVPSVWVEDLGYLSKTADGPPRFRLHRGRPESLKDERPHPANAMNVRAPAVVLTHDCEIDKDDQQKGSILVGLVRALDGVTGEDDQEGIRQYTRHRAFYLPASERNERDSEEDVYLQQESYIDLRRITSIRRGTLDEQRRAAMNDDGRLMLQEHLFRFFTRRLLPDDWREWVTEE